jgi:hypothetical protein
MTELKDWKTAYRKESWGGKGSFGIEIRVSINRPLNDNDEKAMHKIADDVETAIMAETMRLDTKEAKVKAEIRGRLLALFGETVDDTGAGRNIFVEEIPNGYCSRWCCSQKPWYRVTTNKGVITLGWRKRVIEIAWQPCVAGKAESLFPGEDVTKIDWMIHAYGYEKAQEYINRLLQ